MSGLKSMDSQTEAVLQSRPLWQDTLGDYVSAIAWSPQGKLLAAASAGGEVLLWNAEHQTPSLLQPSTGQSVDCLAFSGDGQFLAAGGQDGQVHLWCLHSADAALVWESPLQVSLAPTAWVEHLTWHPTANRLAFSGGRSVQIWEAHTGRITATLDFKASSVQGLAWHPQGKALAVAGYQGVKIWPDQHWQDQPYLLGLDSASQGIAWSPDGRYLASANLDRTLTVLEWGDPPPQPFPWLMRGFPGKIRTLGWSSVLADGFPLLASPSAEGIVVWQKHPDDAIGWEGRMLVGHQGIVQAVSFQPGTALLASVAEDGCLYLWHQARQFIQRLEHPEGLACVQWHPRGQWLAAGGYSGELWVWRKTTRAQGFQRR